MADSNEQAVVGVVSDVRLLRLEVKSVAASSLCSRGSQALGDVSATSEVHLG